MKLLIEPLEVVDLEQEIRLERSGRYHLVGIYPYIYMHNSPLGTFTLTFKSGANTIFEKDFTSIEIKSSLTTANNYAHVFFPVIPDSPVQLENGLYTVSLSSTGYTKTNSSFIAWIRQFEDLNNILDYVPTNDGQNPLATRMKILDRGIR